MSTAEIVDAKLGSEKAVVPQITVEEVEYERTQFRKRSIFANVVATAIVPLYRLISIAVLSMILLGLASYLFLTLFYFLSRSWIEPRIISPTDTEVLQLNGQYAQGTLVREELATERLELLVKLRDARRKASDSDQFQKEVKQTAKRMANDNQHNLDTVQAVDRNFQAEAPKILDADKSFAEAALAQADTLYNAHLISGEEWIARKTQLAQLGATALSLRRSSAELDGQKNLLRREIDSYSNLVDPMQQGIGLSSDGLQTRRQLENSRLDQASAKDLSEALSQEVSMIEGAIARQDRLLLSIQNFPYLRAAEQRLTVAFVPYSNATQIKTGTPVYGCSAEVVFCRRVGQVDEALDGEVVDKHPFFNKELRGFFVRVEFQEAKWDRSQVLFIGGAPLLF